MRIKKGNTLEETLLNNIIKNDNECWLWQCGISDGYGTITIKVEGKYKVFRTHILSYELFKGERKGLLVRHTCHNRNCINPDHLELGTYHDNMVDNYKNNPKYKNGQPTKRNKIGIKKRKELETWTNTN